MSLPGGGWFSLTGQDRAGWEQSLLCQGLLEFSFPGQGKTLTAGVWQAGGYYFWAGDCWGIHCQGGTGSVTSSQ